MLLLYVNQEIFVWKNITAHCFSQLNQFSNSVILSRTSLWIQATGSSLSQGEFRPFLHTKLFRQAGLPKQCTQVEISIFPSEAKIIPSPKNFTFINHWNDDKDLLVSKSVRISYVQHYFCENNAFILSLGIYARRLGRLYGTQFLPSSSEITGQFHWGGPARFQYVWWMQDEIE